MTQSKPVERVGSAVCAVGESPLWAPQERALYWVDIEGRRLHRWQAGAGERQWSLPQRPGCIALHEQGGLICALEDRIVRLTPVDDAGGALVADEGLASVEHPQPGMRFNDGRCDRAGRLWVGSMVMDMARASPAGGLYCLAHEMRRVLGDLIVPNGLAFSPEGRTLYLSDSHASVRCIWAFDLSDEGEVGERRLFVDMAQHRGRPDGAAVDADGCYWTCANDGACLLRFTPAGRLDRTIELPVYKPAMCAFGGAQLDELYITSIRPSSIAPDTPAEAAALAGATFVCRPGVQGIAETPFRAAFAH